MSTLINFRWLVPLLLIPVFMLLMAVLFHYKQPRHINQIYGYRTSLSMKNQDTWVVANQSASGCFLYTTIGFLTVLILLLLVVGRAGLIGWFGSFQALFLNIAILSSGLVLVPIIVTEHKLRQVFTSEGIRK